MPAQPGAIRPGTAGPRPEQTKRVEFVYYTGSVGVVMDKEKFDLKVMAPPIPAIGTHAMAARRVLTGSLAGVGIAHVSKKFYWANPSSMGLKGATSTCTPQQRPTSRRARPHQLIPAGVTPMRMPTHPHSRPLPLPPPPAYFPTLPRPAPPPAGALPALPPRPFTLHGTC